MKLDAKALPSSEKLMACLVNFAFLAAQYMLHEKRGRIVHLISSEGSEEFRKLANLMIGFVESVEKQHIQNPVDNVVTRLSVRLTWQALMNAYSARMKGASELDTFQLIKASLPFLSDAQVALLNISPEEISHPTNDNGQIIGPQRGAGSKIAAYIMTGKLYGCGYKTIEDMISGLEQEEARPQPIDEVQARQMLGKQFLDQFAESFSTIMFLPSPVIGISK